MTDSIIQAWQLKRDVGFWRPFQAIAGAADDGNPDTAAADRVDAVRSPTRRTPTTSAVTAAVTAPVGGGDPPDPLGDDHRPGAAVEQQPDRSADLRHAERAGVRHAPRPDLGRAPLPRRDGRRATRIGTPTAQRVMEKLH